MKFFKLISITFLILALWQYNVAFSKTQNNNDAPTTVKSKTIYVKRKSGIIEFIDDAIIENDDTSILADKMIVYYDEEDKENKIDKIDAIDNVKVFNQEFVATGEKGSYNPVDETFVITDNVVFNNGTSIAKGDKFIYDLNVRRGFLVGKKADTKSLKSDRVIVIINEGNE